MNEELFWDELTKESKEMVLEWLSGYAGSEGAIGRVFELYEEGADLSGMSLEEYIKEISPNEFVEYYYEGFITRK